MANRVNRLARIPILAAMLLTGFVATAPGSSALIPAAVATTCTPTAVTANYTADSLSTVDLTARTAATPDIPVGSLPFTVVITPDGTTALSRSYGSNSLLLTSLASRSTVGTVTGFSHPYGIAVTPDGRTAFVANGDIGTVSYVDLATRAKVGSDVTVASTPRMIAVTPDGTTAVVTNSGSGLLSVFSIASRLVTATIAVGSQPWGVAITPDGTTAVVTNSGSSSVSIVDLTTPTAASVDITVGTTPRGVAITPDGTTAVVTNSGSNSVSTIDLTTRTKDPVDLTGFTDPYDVAITADGASAVVTNNGANSVSTIDLTTRTKDAGTIAVGTAPHGVDIVPCGLVGATATAAATGRTVTVTGRQWAPSSPITIIMASEPITLGSVTSRPDGTFTAAFTVDCAAASGEHSITATSEGGLTAVSPVTLPECPPAPVVPTFAG